MTTAVAPNKTAIKGAPAPAPAKTAEQQPAPQPAAQQPKPDQIMTLPPVGPFKPPAKFKTLDQFKAFARASGIGKLPAYQQQLQAAQSARSQGDQALGAHKAALGYDALRATLNGANAELDSAQHPMRDEAAKARAQAEALKPRMDALARQIGSEHVGKALNGTAAGVSAYNAANDQDAGDFVVDGLLAVANAAAAASAEKRAQQLQGQLAQVQAEYAAQIQVAVNFEHAPPDPVRLANAQHAVADAQKAVGAADAQLAPDTDRQRRAQATYSQAKASVENLQAARSYLSNYDQCFTFFSRWSLPRGYKQDLDGFMKSL